jgi:two-component system sensor histidine kinase UhpB
MRHPANVDRTVQSDSSAVARYESVLRAYWRNPDETVLQTARELGREILDGGHGLLELITLHQRASAAVLADVAGTQLNPSLDVINRFLLEALTPFEMTQRGFQAAISSLQESEERYRELFENASDIVFTTDTEGRTTSINRAGERITGYSRDEVRSLDLSVVLPAQSGEGPDGATSGSERREVEMATRTGRRLLLEITTRPVVEGGKLVGSQSIARDITDRRHAEVALRHLNSHLEDKAKRIAHGLHDEAGQLLATVYLRIAEIGAELPPLGRRRMEELRALLDQVDDQLRRLAYELRPTILDDLGLLPACQFLAEGVARRARVRVVVRGSTGGRLPPDVETALYRVVQEALANVGKHARARTAIVEFERTARGVRGHISDDGIGFDVDGVLSRVGPQGLGLMGMRERVVAVGGQFAVRSQPGKGTAVDFDVSLES